MLKQKGFSLIELIMAMAIGTVISLVLSQVFATSTKVKTENDKFGLQIENGRFALESLQRELAHSGFWGGLDLNTVKTYYRSFPTRPTALPDPCVATTAALMNALPIHIQGYDDVDNTIVASLNTCLSDVKTGTDIMVVRRAGTCVVGSTNCDAATVDGQAYFQASFCQPDDGTELAKVLGSTTAWTDLRGEWFTVTTTPSTAANLPLHAFYATNPVACKSAGGATRAPVRPYLIKIFYITSNTSAGDGIPALRVAQIAANAGAAQITSQILVSGVEQMHFEYGIDTSGDSNPEAFTSDPGTYNSCAGTACIDNWMNVVVVRIHLLTRGLTLSPEYSSNRTYTFGQKADGSANDYTPPNDHFRRQYFTTTVRLVNVRG